MPGPGGGGGFSGGGGFGGGGGGFHGGGGGGFHGGGGYHGGHHGPPPPPHHHHHYYGRPYYYGGYYGRGGGGCLSGIVGLVFAAIFCIILAIVLIVIGFGIVATDITKGGSVVYDENKFQTYADNEYSKAFGGSEESYEDNILVVFLVNEDYSDYYCIAWIGDHLNAEVTSMFDAGGQFQTTVQHNVNQTNYRYSLDTDIRNIFNTLDENIVNKGMSSCFRSNCNDNHVGNKKSQIINRTDMPIGVAEPNAALQKFTEDTEIPVVVVVNTAEAVFGKTKNTVSIIMIIGAIILVIIGIVCIVNGARRRRERD